MILGYWAFVAITIKGWVILATVFFAVRGRANRPWRFHINTDAFTVPTMRTPWLVAADHVLFGGFLLGICVDFVLPHGSGIRADWAGALALLGIAVIVAFTYFAVRPAWRGNVLDLTPTGIVYRTPFTDRVVPWDALEPGEPTRRPVRSGLLQLAVTRPELVTQAGPSLGESGKRRLWLPMDFNVHPWFLTDAIRYYVGHPDSRAAIGTEAEHDRLRDALMPAR